MLKNLLRHCGHQEELGRETMSKKHMLSLNTSQMFFSRIRQKMNPKRKKQLSNFLESPYQLEPPIKRFKELTFKKL
jgi:hypothetical protein